ncbi:RICIN domain-containing protein [Collinsella sp. SGI.184]|uniref:RICIN domain-containing protein n=1 Tax=Collinsella sp. SGI.184 TaxID=3420556 RepID=UPI003D06120D
MGRKKSGCISLQAGFLLCLLLVLPFVPKSGSTAFAEVSAASLSFAENLKTEDDVDPSQNLSLDEATQDVDVSDGGSDIESESSAEAGDLSQYSILDRGAYFLTSALSGHRVLDVVGGSVSVGAAIQLYGRKETAAQ